MHIPTYYLYTQNIFLHTYNHHVPVRFHPGKKKAVWANILTCEFNQIILMATSGKPNWKYHDARRCSLPSNLKSAGDQHATWRAKNSTRDSSECYWLSWTVTFGFEHEHHHHEPIYWHLQILNDRKSSCRTSCNSQTAGWASVSPVFFFYRGTHTTKLTSAASGCCPERQAASDLWRTSILLRVFSRNSLVTCLQANKLPRYIGKYIQIQIDRSIYIYIYI